MPDKRKKAATAMKPRKVARSKKHQKMDENGGAYNPKLKGLMSLPNELLLQITRYFDTPQNSPTLLLLTHVCRSMSAIVLETVIQKDSILPPWHVWPFLGALLHTSKPAEELEHLSLTSLTPASNEQMASSEFAMRIKVSTQAWKACSNILHKASAGRDMKTWLISLLLEETFTSSGLSVLFAMTTSLRSLSLNTSNIKYLPLLANVFRPPGTLMTELHLDWNDHAAAQLYSKLEVLEINLDCTDWASVTWHGGWHDEASATPPLRFKDFAKLRHLSAPIAAIVRSPLQYVRHPGIPCAHLCEEMPHDLEFLRLYVPEATEREQSTWEDWVLNICDCHGWVLKETHEETVVEIVRSSNECIATQERLPGGFQV